MRRLLIFSYLQIFCFAPFILINFVNQDRNRDQNSLKDSFVISAKEHASKICVAGLGISMPCSLLYSRIPIKLAGLYIATLTIFAITRLSYGLKGLVAQTTTSYSQLYEGDSQGTYTYS